MPPAFGTDDNQIDIQPSAPEPIERVEHMRMPLARLDGADHKKAGPGREPGELSRGVLW